MEFVTIGQHGRIVSVYASLSSNYICICIYLGGNLTCGLYCTTIAANTRTGT